MGKISFAVTLTAVMLAGLLQSAAAQGPWNCGALTNDGGAGSVTAALSGGTLTISGTGAMADYTINSAPWYSSRDLITNVVIAAGVTSVGNNSFNSHINLASATIGNGVTVIGSNAFQNCVSLTSVTVGNSVAAIGEGAFRSCRGLASITIPNSVLTIGSSAFENSGLTSITIPNGVASIGANAFNGSRLTTVAIPVSVTSIVSSAFISCSSLVSINVDAANPNYSSEDGVLFNKDKTTLVRYPGGKEGPYAIPYGVTTIEGFSRSFGLTSLIIPGTVTSFGSSTFAYCENLTTVIINEGVTSIANFMFNGCINLTSVNIPNTVTSIGGSAFQSCRSLTSITIPSSVTSITGNSFTNCTNLVSVEVESGSASYISENGVLLNRNKTALVLYPTAKQGSHYSIPSSVTTIGERAFANNNNLTSITIPAGVTSIGSYAFSNCRGLTSIALPGGLTSISANLFSNSVNLSFIAIPNGVTSIGQSAFQNCTGLNSITIPASVTSIGIMAFLGCTGLTSIISSRDIPPAASTNAFSGVNTSTAILYVPSGSIDAYKAAAQWGDFINVKPVLECGRTPGTVFATLEEGTLTVSGIGAMADYDGRNPPWYGLKDNIVKVVIEDGVTYIGKRAFYNYTNLAAVNIGASAANIGAEAFYGCNGLNSIISFRIAPPAVGSPSAFGGVNPNACLYVPQSSITNYREAFGWDYFNSCTKSTNEASYLAVFNSLGGSAVTSQSVVYGSSLQKPADPVHLVHANYGFMGWYKDAALTLEWDFQNDAVTRDITLYAKWGWDCGVTPGSVIAVLRASDSLLTVSGEGDMANYAAGGAPWYGSRNYIAKITFQDGVTSVGNSAFYGLKNIHNVNGDITVRLGSTVTSVGNNAFQNSTLQYITTASVISIGIRAFADCESLYYVSIGANVASIGNFAFENSNLIHFAVSASNADFSSEDGVLFNKTRTALIRYSGVRQGAYNVPGSVTVIGDNAFLASAGLTSVIIPNSVTSIGGSAFQNCINLNSVTIGSGVASIGSQAFAGCAALTSITNLRTTPQTIDATVFDGVNRAAACLYVPQSAAAAYNTAAQWSAFTCRNTAWDCGAAPQTVTATLANGTLTVVGNGAMMDYAAGGAPWYASRASITNVVIENGVTSIGNNTFAECANLVSVTAANNVTSIGTNAFSNCVNLKSVDMGSGVTSIGNNAFNGCSGLNSITIPRSVTSIGSGAFSNCGGLTSITSLSAVPPATGGAATFTGMNKAAAYLYVPHESADVYRAANDWEDFANISSAWDCGLTQGTVIARFKEGVITISGTGRMSNTSHWRYFNEPFDAVIEEGVTSIGDRSFFYTSSLNSITIPNSVTLIDELAFAYATNLVSITIPSGVTTIAREVFIGCSRFASIDVAADNASFSSQDGVLFNKNKTVLITYPRSKDGAAYTIPASVDTIGSYAFQQAAGLTSITIPAGVTHIGDNAFSGCSGLTSITIPGSVTFIGSNAFWNCTNLASVDIPDGVISIGNSAFSGCANLTSVTIGSGAASIGSQAFGNCVRLAAIEVSPDNNNFTSENGVLFSKNKTELIQYPGARAGAYVIPDGVTSIGSAFQNHRAITSITIPGGIRSLGAAFSDATALNTIICLSVPPPASSASTFNNVNKTTTAVFVPQSDIAAYRAAAGWRDFTNMRSVIERGYPSIAFVSNGGSPVTSQVLAQGEKAVEPADPIRTNYIFGGWYKDDLFTEMWDFDDAVTADLTFYAKWYMWECGKIPQTVYAGLDEVTGTLTVSGFGEMMDYTAASDAPWADLTDNITEAVIEEGVTSIGDYAFYYSTKLASVTISNSVANIGNSAFQYCTELVSIISLRDEPPAVGSSNTFNNVHPNICVFVPQNSMTAYQEAAVWKDLGCIKSAGDAGYPTVTFNSMGGSAVNPQIVLSGSKAEKPADPVHSYNYNLIGWYKDDAFTDAWDFNSDAVTADITLFARWGWDCGTAAGMVIAVLIDETLTISGTGAMANYTSNTLPWRDFRSSITNAVIEEGVTSIGSAAFSEYTGLMSIEAASNNPNYSSVDGVLFNKNQTALIAYPGGKQGGYIIPNGVTEIGNEAFYGCINLTTVTIGSGVTFIGEMAFGECKNLTAIISFNPVAPEAGGGGIFFVNEFGGPNPDACVYVPQGSIAAYQAAAGWMDFSCIEPIRTWDCGAAPGTVTAALHNGTLTVSGAGPMANYSGPGVPWHDSKNLITNVVIEDGVTTVGDDTFNGCPNLTDVVIGSSVDYIGTTAFGFCTGISSITSLSAVPPPLGVNAFMDVNKAVACVYVLPGSAAAYTAAWGFTCTKSAGEAGYPTVTFNSNGGSAVDPLLLVSGDKITKPADPALTDYAFAGWYKDAAFTNAWDFAVDVITDDITLYAKWAGSITAAAITVTAPQTGIAPNTAAAGSGNFSVGTVTWTPVTPTGLFLGGTQYTAAVTLTATGNYAFTGITTGSNLTINGNNAVIVENTYTALTISYQFSSTDAKTVDGISIKNQPAKLTYTHGDVFDMTGLLVTLAYNDGTTADAAFANFAANTPVITTSVANGITLTRASHDNMSVTVLCNGYSVNTDNITVNKAAQTALIITPPETKTYGDDNFQLSFTGGTTGNAVVYTVVGGSGSVTSDGLVTIESAGDIVIRAAMAGDVNYEDVTAEIVITVNKLVQAELAITPVESKTYGDAPFQLSFTGGTTGGAVAYTVLSGPASVTANGLVTINGAGGIVISAKMAGGANYEDVTAQIIITVNRAAQEKPDTSRTFEDPSVISSGIPGISVEIDENGGISYKRDESKNLQYCIENCIDDDANWFDDFDFASLPSNKEYAVYIRAKGTDDYHASEPQEIQFRTITEALSVKERDRSLPAGGFGIGDGVNRDRASESRYGIFVDRRVVFGKAVFTVVTPGKVNADIIVYDNLGNAVFRAQNVKSGKAVLWNLTNRSGRSVGNGTYLVSVFFRDANGKIHKYSEYVYVRR